MESGLKTSVAPKHYEFFGYQSISFLSLKCLTISPDRIYIYICTDGSFDFVSGIRIIPRGGMAKAPRQTRSQYQGFTPLTAVFEQRFGGFCWLAGEAGQPKSRHPRTLLEHRRRRGKTLDLVLPEDFRLSHHLAFSNFSSPEESQVVGHPLVLKTRCSDGSEIKSEHFIFAERESDQWFFGAQLKPLPEDGV